MVEYSHDNDIIMVAVGIDGPEPPRTILRDVEEMVQTRINEASGTDIRRDSVTLSTMTNPTEEQRDSLGRSAIHIQQYDVELGVPKLNMEVANALHNEIVDVLNENGFNITGTATNLDPRV